MEKNNKIILIVAIILIPVFGILGWALGSKLADKEESVVDNKKKEDEIELLSMEEAEMLIEKYHAYDYRQYKDGFTEDLKQVIVLKNVGEEEKFNKKKCDEVFDIIDNELSDDSMVNIDGEFYCCFNETSVVKYDVANDIYKQLFGSKKDMPKTKFSEFLTMYNYVENIDSFASSYLCNAGLEYWYFESYNVLNVNVVDNQLIIDVQYVKFDSSTNSEGDNIFIIEELDSLVYLANDLLDEEGKAKDDVVAALFEEYAEQLPVYKYVFEKENDNLILVDFYKAEN